MQREGQLIYSASPTQLYDATASVEQLGTDPGFGLNLAGSVFEVLALIKLIFLYFI